MASTWTITSAIRLVSKLVILINSNAGIGSRSAEANRHLCGRDIQDLPVRSGDKIKTLGACSCLNSVENIYRMRGNADLKKNCDCSKRVNLPAVLNIRLD